MSTMEERARAVEAEEVCAWCDGVGRSGRFICECCQPDALTPNPTVERLTRERDALREKLAEALHEVRTLRDILDSNDETADAYIDAFIKRGPAPAAWSVNLNAADNRRAE